MTGPLDSGSPQAKPVPHQMIQAEESYEMALVRIEALLDAQPSTPQADELEALATQVEAYEDRVHPAGSSTPLLPAAGCPVRGR